MSQGKMKMTQESMKLTQNTNMNTNLEVFRNAEFGQIRVVELNGEPWMVGKDVAEILGYERPTKAVNDHVDAEDIDGIPIQDSIGRMQNTPIINESGLYSLVLSSKLPTAKRFKRWVTGEVLPSIRKHGMYATEDLLSNPRKMAEVFLRLAEEQDKRRALQLTVDDQRKEIEIMKPKAHYVDQILASHDVIPLTIIAKDYGMSAVRLNRLLEKEGIQYKMGGTWILYQRYAEQGFTHTKTSTFIDEDGNSHPKQHMYWTQKGRLFLYDFLKDRGVLPVVEWEA